MKGLLKILLDNSDYYEFNCNELRFVANNDVMFVVVGNYAHLETDSIKAIEKVNVSMISDVIIKVLTPLPVEDQEPNLLFEEPVSYKCYCIVNSIYNAYPEAIESYEIGQFLIDNYTYCCENLGYGLCLSISKNYWENNDLINYILHNCRSFINNIPNFYNDRKYVLADVNFYKLYNNYIFPKLTSNTKIRRLGYLKLLVCQFEQKSKFPEIKFAEKFELYVQQFNEQLSTHKNNKGIVQVSSGSSADPYIELAKDLLLVHKSIGYFELGKFGQVYIMLKQEIDGFDNNVFEMSPFDISFLLEQLLSKDFLFIYLILEQTYVHKKLIYSDFKGMFRELLLRFMRRVISKTGIKNSLNETYLKEFTLKIKSWKDSYMEHILMPRLNWLYDLNLINLKKNLSFELTKTGEKLFFNISIWQDIGLDVVINPITFLKTFYLNVICNMNDCDSRQFNIKCHIDLFTNYMDYCFEKFKTIAPNRVTFSLTATYIKYIMFWKHSIVIDTEKIQYLLENDLKESYIYKYQPQYNDGYIQKRK